MNEVRDIFVSVIMITYKHEQFIAKAIEGILMQKCDFEVELIIADDCSPDKTEEKVFQIIKNHPKNSWIKYTKHKTNKGMISNFNWVLNQCKGKYIAMCEGDDYWTDPLKLQKQVDFLETNSDFNLCFHKVYYVDENNKEIPFNDYNKDTKEVTCFEDLAPGNYINTCSILLRNLEILKSPPTLLNNALPGDWVINLLVVGKKGKIKMFNQQMAAYRLHSGGVWGLKNKNCKICKNSRKFILLF
jgi:glycosyltransferase involved in cell wall biosynthesis